MRMQCDPMRSRSLFREINSEQFTRGSFPETKATNPNHKEHHRHLPVASLHFSTSLLVDPAPE